MPVGAPSPSVGVVGHVEWVTHAFGRVPAAGEIVDLRDPLQEPAGGGGVAAAAMARTARSAALFTAMGDDDAARSAADELAFRGVRVVAAPRPGAQTRVLSITSPGGERTIMVVGSRMQATGEDALPWDDLAAMRAVYYAGEDPQALLRARAATILVVTGRRLDDLVEAGVRADVVVASAADTDEDPWGLPPKLAPRAIVLTDGAAGGIIHEAGCAPRRYAPAPLPGEMVDSYGCGDTFAAVLAVSLGAGASLDDAATAAARAGAACATWRGGLGPPA
jgi:ribokinase